MNLLEEVKAMSKAQFAVNILKEYAEKENTTIRGTTDLSPLEEWLILRLKVKEEALLFNAKVNVDLIRKNHELLSKAGWVKKKETDFFNMVKEGLLAFGYSETKSMNTAAFLFGYHKLKSRQPELFKEMYPQPLSSPPQNK